MSEASRDAVASLPYVRWVGPYEPAYRIDADLLTGLQNRSLSPSRYNIMATDRGPEMQDAIAARIRAAGGTVHTTTPEGFRLVATLSNDQLLAAVNDDDVLFIDQWSPPSTDMDIVRAVGGANFIETTLGFRGEGVRAEVMDDGLRFTHNDFTSGLAPIAHGSSNEENHGTSTYGINFGRGTTLASSRGMLPEAQGIFADFGFLTNRYAHTAALKTALYNAVYQSNSWGDGVVSTYSSISAEMDDILFINDLTVLNSQSNTGSQLSRPQAWAKNIVSVGGINHYNTPSFTDDLWHGNASIGPAADGRIKPDLADFNDNITTTTGTSNTAHVTDFNGTSASTPITAGHFGLFFQMWHNGVFGNSPSGATVFDSRPHMTTAKAVMINTAVQWDMTIPGTDIARENQGFGRVDAKNLYDLREKMLIINETLPLTNLQTRSHIVQVPMGSTVPLKVTMDYNDPMGSPSAAQARINDLTLKVTSPSGVVYWGNYGLDANMWSTPGGTADTVDTVENVFIQSPEAGTWNVDVIASEINQDARVETPMVVDADYALVVSGIDPFAPTAATVSVTGRVVNANGAGIRNATVTLQRQNGEVRTAITSTFGFYRIDGIPAGETCFVNVSAKRFTFANPTRTLALLDDVDDVNFIAD